MAVVHRLEQLTLEKDSPHSEADCTYSIVSDDQGQRYLQVDTYGSATSPDPGQEEPVHTFRSKGDRAVETIACRALLKAFDVSIRLSEPHDHDPTLTHCAANRRAGVKLRPPK
jgi:hypothetical protein